MRDLTVPHKVRDVILHKPLAYNATKKLSLFNPRLPETASKLNTKFKTAIHHSFFSFGEILAIGLVLP